MKKMLWLSFGMCLSLSLAAQTWTWETTPAAGENAVIRIEGVPLDKDLHITYHGFDGMNLLSNDVGLIAGTEPGVLRGAFVIHDHMTWVRVVLKDENNQALSSTEVTVPNPGAPPKTAELEKAIAGTLYGSRIGIDRDDAGNLERFRSAIDAYPVWINTPDVVRLYYSLAKRQNATADLDRIKAWVNQVAAKPSDYLETTLVQAHLGAKDMGDSITAASLRKAIDKRYPASSLAQQDMLAKFRKTEDLAGQVALREQFKKKYPVTKDNKPLLDQMTGTIVQAYADLKDWKNVQLYAGQTLDPFSRAQTLNEYAWALSGETLDSPGTELEIAKAMSAASLQSLEDAKAEPVPGFTSSEWAGIMDSWRGQLGDTYALIRYKQGAYAEAADYQAFAVKQNEYSDADMNERYVAYLEKAGRAKELEVFMDEAITNGKASPKILEMHKAHWSDPSRQAGLYDRYLASLEAQAHQKMVDKVREEWTDQEAKGFMLTDLNGHIVNLSDYAGKTVVLDFWATWCGPCKASFPGMKMAVEHYNDDPGVAFLFIDTWEQGEDAPQRVASFIQDNNYPFYVLMDRENKVVGDYGVSGIPTKFIVGPDQRIHFISKGFGGNNDELFEELKVMIEMARQPGTTLGRS